MYAYIFAFTGFLSPAGSPPTLNMAHGGQAIPIQFQLGGNQGLNIIAGGNPTAQQISCSTGAPLNTSTLTDTSGNSGPQYDPGTNTYTYVWKTLKSYQGTCPGLHPRPHRRHHPHRRLRLHRITTPPAAPAGWAPLPQPVAATRS